MVLLWVVMVGTECFEEGLFLANKVLYLFSGAEMTRCSLQCIFPAYIHHFSSGFCCFGLWKVHTCFGKSFAVILPNNIPQRIR